MLPSSPPTLPPRRRTTMRVSAAPMSPPCLCPSSFSLLVFLWLLTVLFSLSAIHPFPRPWPNPLPILLPPTRSDGRRSVYARANSSTAWKIATKTSRFELAGVGPHIFFVSAEAAVLAVKDVKMCVAASDNIDPLSHTYWALERDRAAYLAKGLNFSLRIVGAPELGPTEVPSRASVVADWVVTGAGDCSVLIGPGFSSWCSAIAPVVQESHRVFWLSYSATAVSLSDAREYPTFSRVVPTDSFLAKSAAAFFAGTGLTTVNVLCVNENYGRSVSSAVASEMRKLGGTVHEQCIEPEGSDEEIIETLKERLQPIKESGVRTVYFAGASKYFGFYANATMALGLQDTLISFASESACSAPAFPFSTVLPGAFCATYQREPSWTANAAAYVERNLTDVTKFISDAKLTIPDNGVLTATAVFSAFVEDAVRLSMLAVYECNKDNTGPSIGANATDMSFANYLACLRAVKLMDGFTGNVMLDAKGDRVSANATLLNAGPDGVIHVPGSFMDGSSFSHNNSVPYYVMGEFRASMPAPLVTGPAESTSLTVVLLGALLGACAVIILGAAIGWAVYKCYFAASSTRAAENAPPGGPRQPFALAVMDVQAATTLWARSPEHMSDSLSVYHAVVRSLVSKHRGYEVKTLGESFMVAFRNPHAAVHFSLQLQAKLYEAEWPDELETVYRDMTNDKRKWHDYSLSWSGLRVRVATHFGEGTAVPEADGDGTGVDYIGSVVATAVELLQATQGGQILATRALLHAAGGATAHDDEALIKAVGHLRGYRHTEPVMQLLPRALSYREFSSRGMDTANSSVSQLETASAFESTYKGSGSGGQPTKPIQASDSLVAFARTMLAALPEARRKDTLQLLASRWRVRSDGSRVTYDSLLRALTANVTRALPQKFQKATANDTAKPTRSSFVPTHAPTESDDDGHASDIATGPHDSPSHGSGGVGGGNNSTSQRSNSSDRPADRTVLVVASTAPEELDGENATVQPASIGSDVEVDSFAIGSRRSSVGSRNDRHVAMTRSGRSNSRTGPKGSPQMGAVRRFGSGQIHGAAVHGEGNADGSTPRSNSTSGRLGSMSDPLKSPSRASSAAVAVIDTDTMPPPALLPTAALTMADSHPDQSNTRGNAASNNAADQRQTNDAARRHMNDCDLKDRDRARSAGTAVPPPQPMWSDAAAVDVDDVHDDDVIHVASGSGAASDGPSRSAPASRRQSGDFDGVGIPEMTVAQNHKSLPGSRRTSGSPRSVHIAGISGGGDDVGVRAGRKESTSRSPEKDRGSVFVDT